VNIIRKISLLCFLAVALGYSSFAKADFDFSNFSLNDAPPIVIEATPTNSTPYKVTKRNKDKTIIVKEGSAATNGGLVTESEIPMISSYFFYLNKEKNKILLKLSTNEGWVHNFIVRELKYDSESNQIVLLDRLDRIPVAYNTGPVSKKSDQFKFENYNYTCFDWNLYSDEGLFLPSIRIYLNRALNCKEKLQREKLTDPEKI
jgi:hypothetical protein